MGNIAASLRPHFASDSRIKWTLKHFNGQEWDMFVKKEFELNPFKRNELGQIESGFFRLTSLGSEKKFGAYGWASND